MTPFEKILLSMVAFFSTGGLYILIHFLKSFSNKLDLISNILTINVQKVKTNDKEIDSLKWSERDHEKRITRLETIKMKQGQEVLG